MAYKLLKIVHSEIDANLLKGRLESEGFDVKINAVSTGPRQYPSFPDNFGLYLQEDDMERAGLVLSEHSVLSGPASRSSRLGIIISLISLGLVLLALFFSKIL